MKKYKIVKLDPPVFRSGRRVFTHKIVNIESKKDVFFFEDDQTANQTLEKLK